MTPDQFISRLYRESAQVALADFPCWALDLLQQVISFDGAIWGTGHSSTQEFHTQASVDVDKNIFNRLKETLNINPIFAQLMLNPSSPVDMADVVKDDEFYQSPIYQQCFQPFGIERILSSMHVDDRSGIFTLLTLYRYDRQNTFSTHEKAIQQQLLFHLLSASSHRQFLALNESEHEEKDESNNTEKQVINTLDKYAICDAAGIYHVVGTGFLDIIEYHTGVQQQQKLPFAIDESKKGKYSYNQGNLHISQLKLGDLFRITIRLKNHLDDLSSREKQVVAGICQGNTFKQIAKNLGLSPSTVSNHLYRIYLKLGINSRSELVALAKK